MVDNTQYEFVVHRKYLKRHEKPHRTLRYVAGDTDSIHARILSVSLRCYREILVSQR